MDHPFEMWSDRIVDASTEDARRALLVEARVFRAKHLSDVASVRRATFTISRLHAVLGEREPAVHEARQLLSLCQTTPVASREEIDAARSYLQGLGEHAPKIVSPPRERSWKEGRGRPEPRHDRPARQERPRPAAAPASSSAERVRELASDGQWARALAALGEERAPGADLLRVTLRLSLALEAADPLAEVRRIRDDLARRAGLGRPRTDDDPLSQLLGAPVSPKRAARIDAIEAFADAHPDRIDELAAAALRHHLASSGPGAAAPWLVGTVARALASGGAERTEAALAELRAAGSVAVQAYDEWPFTRILRLVARAASVGVRVSAVRRGILARNEPDDRKLWTMRVVSADGERMLAVAPHAVAAYEGDKARELAERLHALSGSALLLATGSGNEGLRSAAAALGLSVRDRDGDDAELLGAVLALPAAAAPATRVRPPVAERSPEPAGEERRPSTDRLADLVGQVPLDRARIEAAVRSMSRPDRALRIVQKLSLTDEALALVLEVVAATIGNDRPIPEGTTLALKGALTGDRARRMLADPRYGGPGVDTLVDVARALHAGGWEVHRVLRGATRRETTQHPALESLASGLGGLWRLLVRRNGRKGEVWFVAALPPEGRGAVPLLLLEDWQRAVVIPAEDAELRAWWGAVGPAAIPWGEGGAAALVAAVEAFVERADGPAEDEAAASS